jgi:hypothetical protein
VPLERPWPERQVGDSRNWRTNAGLGAQRDGAPSPSWPSARLAPSSGAHHDRRRVAVSKPKFETHSGITILSAALTTIVALAPLRNMVSKSLTRNKSAPTARAIVRVERRLAGCTTTAGMSRQRVHVG